MIYTPTSCRKKKDKFLYHFPLMQTTAFGAMFEILICNSEFRFLRVIKYVLLIQIISCCCDKNQQLSRLRSEQATAVLVHNVTSREAFSPSAEGPDHFSAARHHAAHCFLFLSHLCLSPQLTNSVCLCLRPLKCGLQSCEIKLSTFTRAGK